MSRSLWPREHGAYPQLLAPLTASLAAAVPTPSALLLAAGACLAFLAHEPLLVVVGHRGRRLREESGARARTRLVALGLAAVAAGTAGLVLAPSAALAISAVVAVPVVVLLALVSRHAEKTLPGEMVAATALAGAAAPVAIASGLPVGFTLAVWLGWSVGFAATVVAVHRVIARHRRPPTSVDRLAGVMLALVTAGAMLAATRTPELSVAVPLAGLSTVLVLRPPSATRLRAIGLGLTLAAVVATALALVST